MYSVGELDYEMCILAQQEQDPPGLCSPQQYSKLMHTLKILMKLLAIGFFYTRLEQKYA